MNGIFLTTTFQWDWKCCLCICTSWDLTAFAISCIPHISEENLRCWGVCRRRWPSCFIQEWEWDEVGEAQDGMSSLLVLTSYLPWSFFWVLIINCNTEVSWETSTYLPIHSSIHLSTHPSTYPSIQLSVHPTIYPSVHQSTPLLTQPFIHLAIHSSTHPFNHPSNHLSTLPSIHPSV